MKTWFLCMSNAENFQFRSSVFKSKQNTCLTIGKFSPLVPNRLKLFVSETWNGINFSSSILKDRKWGKNKERFILKYHFSYCTTPPALSWHLSARQELRSEVWEFHLEDLPNGPLLMYNLKRIVYGFQWWSALQGGLARSSLHCWLHALCTG